MTQIAGAVGREPREHAAPAEGRAEDERRGRPQAPLLRRAAARHTRPGRR